jgi:predicted amidohydrolase YtcJ
VGDVVFVARIVTMDEARPDAEALGVSHGRVTAIGSLEWVRAALPDAPVVRIDGCVLPGFVEAHGHPSTAAVLLSEHFVDIRPVTVPSAADVVAAVRQAVAERPHGAYLNGWDPLLQVGLPEATLEWLDDTAPTTPLVILHNSGHSVYFNSLAASAAGLDRHTPDPPGARYGRTPAGELDGSGYETAAIFAVAAPGLAAARATYGENLAAELGRLNAAGITTVSDMAWDPALTTELDETRAAGGLTARLRLYEMSTPALRSSQATGSGDGLVRQVGIKTWADGSPWIGNIDTSFPYLDTPATRGIGLPPGHRGASNYTPAQFDAISKAYFDQGWQLSCHAHGDSAIDMVLDCWDGMLAAQPRPDHRLRLEHVGAMRPDQYDRAAALGVTCSLFVDHLYYWGDVLADDLLGAERAAAWANAGAAAASGMPFSFHNDGTVTPPEPLRNITVAMTRQSRSGRVHGAGNGVNIDQALRAQTLDAAFQLFAEADVGSLEVGKYADMVVLSDDPRTVPPDAVADLTVLGTYLAGNQVYADPG